MSNEGAARDLTKHEDRPATRRPLLAAVVIPLAWAVVLFFGACLAILVPFNLILIPCWLVVGSSLGTLARELLDPKPERSAHRAANVTRRPARPAHEGSMEGRLVGEA